MAVLKNKETCASCRFFSENERMGTCQRFPTFVNKYAHDWCGEWQLEESVALDVMVQQVTEPTAISEPKKQRGRPKK
jgi:hypothetical protein